MTRLGNNGKPIVRNPVRPQAQAVAPVAPSAMPRKLVGSPDFGGSYGGGSGFSPAAGVDPRLAGLTQWMQTARDKDLAAGKAFADPIFGANNPEMKAILDARREAAFGNDGQTDLARQAGMEGINRSVQTALRQFSGRLPSTGVRGGAAGAMAGMLTRDAVGQTRGLERDLALNEMERKRTALEGLEKTVTGERAGLLGTTFGMAGLGSQDRYGGMQYLSSGDFLANAGGTAPSGPNTPYWARPDTWMKYHNPGDPLNTDPITGGIMDKLGIPKPKVKMPWG